jgi:starch synthase (maltosyl-transferring)
VFVVVNTDPHAMQHGWVQVPLARLGVTAGMPYTVVDLLDGSEYTWRGEWNYVRFDPAMRMGHVLVARRL